ncbi:hypothetical protein R84B8_00849 [Treponema sp. R8-4-B8]
MMAELYGVTVAAINQHIKKIFEDSDFDRFVELEATVKKQADKKKKSNKNKGAN